MCIGWDNILGQLTLQIKNELSRTKLNIGQELQDSKMKKKTEVLAINYKKIMILCVLKRKVERTMDGQKETSE